MYRHTSLSSLLVKVHSPVSPLPRSHRHCSFHHCQCLCLVQAVPTTRSHGTPFLFSCMRKGGSQFINNYYLNFGRKSKFFHGLLKSVQVQVCCFKNLSIRTESEYLAAPKSLLQEWQGRKMPTKCQLQSLIGDLGHTCHSNQAWLHLSAPPFGYYENS